MTALHTDTSVVDEEILQHVEEPSYLDSDLEGLTEPIEGLLGSSTDAVNNLLLAEVANKLDGTRASQINKLLHSIDPEAIRATYSEALRQSQDAVKQLTASLGEYKQQAQRNKKIVNDRIERLRVAKREMDTLLAEAESLEGEITEVDSIIKSSETIVGEYKQRVESQEQATSQRHTELSATIARYQQCLGIAFRQDVGSDNVTVVFTGISTKQPEKEFTFKLKLNDKRNYEVSDCDPAIPVVELVEKLIATNNLRKFIIEVRKLFVASETAESACAASQH